MSEITLTTAAPGDRFEARDGEAWRYVQPDADGFHLLLDPAGNLSSFRHDGLNCVSRSDLVATLPAAPDPETNERAIADLVRSQNEYYEAWRRKRSALIRALDSPAPAPAEPMGDAGLVERLRSFIKPHVHISAAHKDALAEAATRLATLSAENAKHVTAANEAQAEIDQLHADAEEMAAALDEALRAARDWHSKHGSGGND